MCAPTHMPILSLWVICANIQLAKASHMLESRGKEQRVVKSVETESVKWLKPIMQYTIFITFLRNSHVCTCLELATFSSSNILNTSRTNDLSQGSTIFVHNGLDIKYLGLYLACPSQLLKSVITSGGHR